VTEAILTALMHSAALVTKIKHKSHIALWGEIQAMGRAISPPGSSR
jgi:hypothetical protein